MSLPDSYFDYPKRRRGMDHDYYPWSNLFQRAPLQWPEGRKVAIAPVISLEWFPIIPSDGPFKAPGHMQTSYPDFRHYSARDYGSRIGIYRLLESFQKRNIRVAVATNAVIAERYPELLQDIIVHGHEIIAHAYDMNDTIAGGMDVAQERAIISKSLETLAAHVGQKPRGWLSIARSQSENTAALLVEQGVDYMLDWVNDELPYRFTAGSGDIINIPLNHELHDFQIMRSHQQGIESFCEQIVDAYDCLHSEYHSFGGRLLSLHLTPYITGLAHSAQRFDALIDDLAARDGAWFATPSEILDACAGQI